MNRDGGWFLGEARVLFARDSSTTSFHCSKSATRTARQIIDTIRASEPVCLVFSLPYNTRRSRHVTEARYYTETENTYRLAKTDPGGQPDVRFEIRLLVQLFGAVKTAVVVGLKQRRTRIPITWKYRHSYEEHALRESTHYVSAVTVNARGDGKGGGSTWTRLLLP